VLLTAPLQLRLERRTPWRPALVPRRTRSKSHLRCAQGTPAPSIAPRAVTTTPNGSCRLYIPPALRVVETSLAVSPATSAMSAPRGPPSGFQSLAVALSFPSPHLCPLSSLHRSSVHSGVHASAVYSYPRQHATPATGCCVRNQHTMMTRAKSGYRIPARPIQPAAALLPTPIGEQLWWRNMMPC